MLQDVHPVAYLQDVSVVVRNDDDRYVAARLEVLDEVENQRPSLAPMAASGSSSSRMRAAEYTERATATAWR